MSGCIIFSDETGWCMARWVYCAVLDGICEILAAKKDGTELFRELSDDNGLPRTVHNIELAGWNEAKRMLFYDATAEACRVLQRRGPQGWHDPSGFPTFARALDDLEICVLPGRVPAALRCFLSESCGLDVSRLRPCRGIELPQPAINLLHHDRDMTSTLATHHGSALRVEVLRCRTEGGLYLREVFLRTTAAVGPVPADRIVEYGVLAVALAQFAPEARAAIEAGRKPLGALLHEFKIPFVSAPIGFFSADGAALSATSLAVPAGARCFGRFNCLSLPTGAPLAWIMEILPPPSAA